MRGFIFSNYQSLNNGNLLLELGQILKRKWHKKTKNGMLKLTCIKHYKDIYHSFQHSLPFLSIKKLCNKNLNLTIRFGFQIVQIRIQELAFNLCTQQSAYRKSREGKQLKLHCDWINLDWKLALRNLMF